MDGSTRHQTLTQGHFLLPITVTVGWFPVTMTTIVPYTHKQVLIMILYTYSHNDEEKHCADSKMFDESTVILSNYSCS